MEDGRPWRVHETTRVPASGGMWGGDGRGQALMAKSPMCWGCGGCLEAPTLWGLFPSACCVKTNSLGTCFVCAFSIYAFLIWGQKEREENGA